MTGDTRLVHAIDDAVQGAIAARKASVCLDDARCPVVELMDERVSSEDRAELELCRTSLNSYSQHLQAISKASTAVAERLERLQQEVEHHMTVVQCGSTNLGGARCDQIKGHGGAHTRKLESGLTLRWTDAEVDAELAAWELKGHSW